MTVLTPSTHGASRRRQLVLVYAVAFAMSGFVLIPILWMISTALKGDSAVLMVPPQLVPRSPKWSNFSTATNLIPFWRYLRNSLVVSGLGAIGTVLSAALVAYPLARLRARGMRAVFGLVLATLLLPQQVLLISQFLIFKELGWYGTYLPLIVPSWLRGGAFNVFLLRPVLPDAAPRARPGGARRRRRLLPHLVPGLTLRTITTGPTPSGGAPRDTASERVRPVRPTGSGVA